MPAIKVIDCESKQPRRLPKLWETFGLIGINPTDIKEGKGIHYAIIKQEHIETVISDEMKQIFNQNGFEIATPVEFDTMLSVFLRHIDKVIAEKTNEEIIESVSEALFYTRRDTLFQVPFWGVSDFPVSYHGYYTFLCFLCGFLIAGVRKTQEDTLKVFIYQNTRHAKQQHTGGIEC